MNVPTSTFTAILEMLRYYRTVIRVTATGVSIRAAFCAAFPILCQQGPRNCNVEFAECTARGMVLCGGVEIAVPCKSPWVYRTCVYLYGLACTADRQSCQQWNIQHGYPR